MTASTSTGIARTSGLGITERLPEMALSEKVISPVE